MVRRVELDAELTPLEIPGGVFLELCEHARNSYPEECCGLIFGTEHRRFARVERCRNEMNQRHEDDPARYPRDNRTGFWMSQVDYLRAMEEGEQLGERVTAVYHSHVNTGVYLSEDDLSYIEPYAVFPDADHIVISVHGEAIGGEEVGKVSIAGIFRRDGVGRPFVGRRLVPVTP